MSYDPMMYNQYLRFPMQAQPVNGLVFIDKNMIDSYQMPPGSVSPPLFIDDTHFVIKTFDQSGGSAVECFEAKSIPASDLVEQVGAKYRSLSPDEKMMMKSKIIEKLM